MTRAHLFLPFAFAAAAGALAFACSAPPPAADPDPEATAPVRSADPPLGTGSSSSGGSSSGTTSGGAPDAGDGEGGGGGNGDGGGGGTGDGGGNGGGGGFSKCKGDSVRETEANDTPATADILPAPGSFCGSVGDKAVDHMAFTLPANATSFNTGGDTSRGNFKMELIVNGNTQDLSGNLPFSPGSRYVIRITNTGGGPVDYRVDATWK